MQSSLWLRCHLLQLKKFLRALFQTGRPRLGARTHASHSVVFRAQAESKPSLRQSKKFIFVRRSCLAKNYLSWWPNENQPGCGVMPVRLILFFPFEINCQIKLAMTIIIGRLQALLMMTVVVSLSLATCLINGWPQKQYVELSQEENWLDYGWIDN